MTPETRAALLALPDSILIGICGGPSTHPVDDARYIVKRIAQWDRWLTETPGSKASIVALRAALESADA